MDRLRLPEGLSGLLVRSAVVLAGGALVFASAYLVLSLAPDDLGPAAGQHQVVSERVEYWTPEDGDQQTLRPRTDRVRDAGESLELVREVQGVHSPRGDRFAIELEEGWRLAEEPAAHASFPPTLPWRKPPETVHLGLPWQTQDGPQIGAFDSYQRLHEVEREGLNLVKYLARESNQFFVDGDTVWFRTAERTALVEPVSGTIVDYQDEETLWRASLDRPFVFELLESARESREKVWEATVTPTPAGQHVLLEQAEAARSDQLEKMLTVGLPLLAVGEVLMGAGIVGRPRRVLAPAE